jgi:hypothetical protein
MDAATVDLLRLSLTKLLGDHDESTDATLAQQLAALGWDEVLADDAPTALRLLFDVRGTTLSDADALGPVLAQVIADSAGRPDLADAALVIPASLHPGRCTSSVADGPLRIEGIVLGQLAGGATVVVPAAATSDAPDGPDGPDGNLRLAVLRRGPDWSTETVRSMDGSPWLRVRGTAPASEASEAEWIAGPTAAAAWDAVITTARWTVAAELVAVGRAVIEHAVEYTGQRRQYGRAIGTFQALQHRLAAAHASIVGAAEVTVEASKSGLPWDALVAKAAAGKAVENACTQAQQCYGAIGFTWEHPLHRYLRRMYTLDRLFGDWRVLEAEIGAALIASGSVPKVGAI